MLYYVNYVTNGTQMYVFFSLVGRALNKEQALFILVIAAMLIFLYICLILLNHHWQTCKENNLKISGVYG